MNHHGPLPLSELHSTDEPIVWILSLFTTCVQSQIHPARDCDTDIMCLLSFFLSFFFFSFSFHFFIFFLSFFFLSFFFLQQVIFLTVNHRGPLPLRELHSTDETIVWRDPGGSWACLWPVYNYEWINSPSQRLWHRYNASSSSSFFSSSFFFLFFSAGCFSYGESPRTPPLEGTSLHRRNNSVERPWGSWACLRPVYNYEWAKDWHRHSQSNFRY